MLYGLEDRDLIHIQSAIQLFPEISQVILFGSRAKGNYKRGSDVDLAIKGKNVNYETAVRLSGILNEEKPLPYFFDVLHYENLNDPELINHIDRVGIPIYKK
ncbi:MAG: nucleotidyltransferase domain-containing protein [Pseudomonadota bacterium]